MAKIAIIGAGRIGTAVAKYILMTSDHEIVFIDGSEHQLTKAIGACADLERPEFRVAFSEEVPIEAFQASHIPGYEAALKKSNPSILVCCTSAFIEPAIANLALKLRLHYLDFSKHTRSFETVAQLEVGDLTFIPGTGFAPGLVTYMALSLLEELGEPYLMTLRSGSLPTLAFSPTYYAITQCPSSLIDQYTHKVVHKTNGNRLEAHPFAAMETVITQGAPYEAFSVSGGIGLMSAYDGIPNVNYKELHYCGHSKWLRDTINDHSTFQGRVDALTSTCFRTNDDVAILACQVADVDGLSASVSIHFYPNDELGLTAIEAVTAGTGAALIELLINGELPSGVLSAKEIPFDQFMATAAMRIVFDQAS